MGEGGTGRVNKELIFMECSELSNVQKQKWQTKQGCSCVNTAYTGPG